MTGAIASHLAMGDSVGTLIFPLIVTGLAAVSWYLRPASRREIPVEQTASNDERFLPDEFMKNEIPTARK